MKTGKVYLTGGGCGDAGLLTIRAAAVLESCDTVVYDSLVSAELLQRTRNGCEKIYVGKRYGSHAMKQEEINALLVEKAQAGRTVVRLKGGDPYLFGRGGEEFQAVQAAGIPCEEIPGISSAIAVPAAAGIPVTHRGLSAGVAVVTGTAAAEGGQAGLSLDFAVLAQFKGTLVILMGMHHLEEIGDGLIAAGKAPDTPCAVIMEGTTGRQRCMRAALSELSAEASAQGFTSPAVIVIGEVAALRLLSEDKAEGAAKTGLPLKGVSVGVTGTPRFAAKLSEALGETGADVWDMSFMEIRRTKETLPDFKNCGWLVFTSPNGVRVFAEKMRQERRDLRTLAANDIAATGQGTAEALEELGIYADYVPETYDVIHLAQGLAERISAQCRGGCGNIRPAVFLRAKQGSDMLPEIFVKKGIPFTEHALYELETGRAKRDAVIARRPDYIVFGSAMGARAYFEGLREAAMNNTHSRYVCIGVQCAGEVRRHTGDEVFIADESGVEGIVECLCRNVRV